MTYARARNVCVRALYFLFVLFHWGKSKAERSEKNKNKTIYIHNFYSSFIILTVAIQAWREKRKTGTQRSAHFWLAHKSGGGRIDKHTQNKVGGK